MLKNNIKKFFTKNIILIILIACITCFFGLAEDVFFHEIMKGDVIGYYFISKYLISDTLTPIMKCITWFGGAFSLLLFSALLFIFIKNKKIKTYILINLFTVTILNQIFKMILQRPRPTEYRIIDETGYSFPSGHSMISMAFYGYLIYLIYKNVKNQYFKWILITALLLLIFLVGLSRVYLGVHYVSDVIAGFVISIAYLIIFVRLTNLDNR